MSKIGIEVATATAALTLLLACDSDSQPTDTTLATDSAGIRIVHSQPMNSDATCAVSEEPTVVIGDDESDERPVVFSSRKRRPDVRRIHRGGRPGLGADPGLRPRWPTPAHDGQARRGTRGIREWSLPDVDCRGRHDLGRRLLPLALQPLQRRTGSSCGGCVSPRSSSPFVEWAEACWRTATP